MIEREIEKLFSDFKALAAIMRQDADLLDQGIIPATFQLHATTLDALVVHFRTIESKLGVQETDSIATLRHGALPTYEIERIRLTFSNGFPRELCVELLHRFNELIENDRHCALVAAESVINLTAAFADLPDEKYEQLRELAAKAFGKRIAVAAGRGTLRLSVPPDYSNDVSTDNAQSASFSEEIEHVDGQAGQPSLNAEDESSASPRAPVNDAHSDSVTLPDKDHTLSASQSVSLSMHEIDQADPVIETIEIPKRPAQLFAEFVNNLRAEAKLSVDEYAEVETPRSYEEEAGINVNVPAAWQCVIEQFSERPILSYNTALALEFLSQTEDRGIIPSWVLRVNVLGGLIGSPDDELEQQLRADLNDRSADDLEVDRAFNIPDRAKAISIVLAGALLRPALIAPNSGAKSLLQSLRHVGGAMHTLSVSVIAAAEKLRSVNVAMIRKLILERAIELKPSDLQREAKSWTSGIELSHQSFAEARKIRRAWLVRDGFLETIVRPAIENDVDSAPELSAILERIDEAFIDRKINEADSRTNKSRIEGNARRQLHEAVASAVLISRRWLTAVGREPQPHSFAKTELANLEKIVADLRPGILKELADLEATASPIVASAAESYRQP